MNFYYGVLACVLILCLLLGMAHVYRGKSGADRMLAAQLFGTIGVAILVVFSFLSENPHILNVALVLAMLAPLTLIAYVRITRKSP